MGKSVWWLYKSPRSPDLQVWELSPKRKYNNNNNKMSQFFQTKRAIKNWLDDMCIKNYTINHDLTVDVLGSVKLNEKNLHYLPCQFNTITMDFDVTKNHLTHLHGLPKKVGGSLSIYANPLKELFFHQSIDTIELILNIKNLEDLTQLNQVNFNQVLIFVPNTYIMPHIYEKFLVKKYSYESTYFFLNYQIKPFLEKDFFNSSLLELEIDEKKIIKL